MLPYRSVEDHIEGVVITFVDIDARKRAEEIGRKNEERLRRVINVEGVGVLIFGASGALIDCNEAFLKMTGFSRADVDAARLNWRSMTPPEFIQSGEEHWQKLAETGRIAPYEKEYFLKNGEREWMVFAGASLGDGTVVEYCVDISGRKRAEREVQESAEKLHISNEALQRANDDLKHFSYALTQQIVLIEDNPADVELVKLAVQEAGVEGEITVFPNGRDALKALAAPSLSFQPSVILLDLNTPRTDGFEVHLKLRLLPRLSQVPIAILTSSRARADKHRAALQGARYVEKPSQLKDFLTTVGSLIKELLPSA